MSPRDQTTEVTAETMRDLARRWSNAADSLRAARDDEIRHADVRAFITSCAGMVDRAVKTLPPRESSGLVAQQAWFLKARP